MKLLFLCASLEPGRDGVGDYSLLLARALRDLGIETALLAIHDHYLGEAGGIGAEGSTHGIPFLRLPKDQPWQRRREIARAFVEQFNPQWVSVQFVSYAFHPRGFVAALGSQIASIVGDAKIHLMFHEVWIGDAQQYGAMERAVGLVQRWCIRRLVHALRPSAVHTSGRVYQELLSRIGVQARRLALPGNVEIAAAQRSSTELGELRSAPTPMWIAGVFGTIHPHWSAEPWMDVLCDSAAEDGRQFVVVQFGEAGRDGRAMWERMAARYAQRARFIRLGRQSAPEISAILAQLDFGLATSPWSLIEKSGASAAFLDHGIPVLVTRDDWKLRHRPTAEPSAHPLLLKISPEAVAILRRGGLRRPPQSRLPAIAQQFVAELRMHRNR